MWGLTRSKKKAQSPKMNSPKRVQFGSPSTATRIGAQRRESTDSADARVVSFNQRVKVFVYELSNDERELKQAAAKQRCRLRTAC
mmetsp:Transcript_15622/g.25563  ORF Transcript_15622/g.25563 Transcript_15622/m.25563 type:complete len:85 (-) Transcript_15622:232-486(-)